MKKFNNPSWNFQLDQVYSYAYSEKVFSKIECEKIIKIAKNEGLIKGTTRGKTDVRLSDITWLYANDDLQWVFRKITDVVLFLNNKYFNFDIFGLNEGLQFTNYKAPSDKYGKHIDRSHDTLVRKLSISIQLTDPKDYQGGELFLYEDEKGLEMSKEQGTLILFPSFILHEVKPVTKGERNSLVSWVTGKQFK
jgi:PKHD-type hydroxylase|tara:strand:+ start:5792 stop:6370 length:579 start_codon:yes stop_codon:yes gene_type:complete